MGVPQPQEDGTANDTARLPSGGETNGGRDGNGTVAGNGRGNGRTATALRETAFSGSETIAARRAATEIAHAALIAANAETAEHSDDVVTVSCALCDRLGVSGEERDDITTAAQLHDVGKVSVPNSILDKPGPLTQAEWASIRQHTVVGDQIVQSVPELFRAARIVRHSHERWDGNGYPDGLAGEDIPLGSRIVACADAFHAIRSDRPYRRGRSAEAALDEIRLCAGSQFDPAVAAALDELAHDYQRAAERGEVSRKDRLVALLLILTVGVGGGALARSGLLDSSGPSIAEAAGPDGGAIAAGPIAGGPLLEAAATCGPAACPPGATTSRLTTAPLTAYGLRLGPQASGSAALAGEARTPRAFTGAFAGPGGGSRPGAGPVADDPQGGPGADPPGSEVVPPPPSGKTKKPKHTNNGRHLGQLKGAPHGHAYGHTKNGKGGDGIKTAPPPKSPVAEGAAPPPDPKPAKPAKPPKPAKAAPAVAPGPEGKLPPGQAKK